MFSHWNFVLLRFVLIVLCVSVADVAAAQSKLKGCPREQPVRWHNCFGALKFANGDKFVGEWRRGLPNGQGVYTWAGGQRYVGAIKNGRLDGQGTYTSATGEIYVGSFKAGNRSGQGTLIWPDGKTYVGEFKGGKRNGKGTETFANGNTYIGEFKDDNATGKGTFYTAASGADEPVDEGNDAAQAKDPAASQ